MFSDWGEASEAFDEIQRYVEETDFLNVNEAQTRYDVVDRIIRDVLGWTHGHVNVEERTESGYIDYTLRISDLCIVVEAKRAEANFPSPTKKSILKLAGNVLSAGEISSAISQAKLYGEEKEADVVVVTNGLCWCVFALDNSEEDSYATILFPFNNKSNPEKLFNLLSLTRVEAGSLDSILNRLPTTENRLISTLKSMDNRVDRNQIANYIAPAIEVALRSDSILDDEESLNKCFVMTDNRTRFDSILGIYLAESKPANIHTAKRIRKDKKQGHLEDIVRTGVPSHAPPVTLIIGPVGVGKSTYLAHFEKISGREILDQQNAHWIYLDFEEMGREANPRAFIYSILRDYLDDAYSTHSRQPTDWDNTIGPAYEDEFRALARGPFALTYQQNKDEYKRKMQEIVATDYGKIEPYVDKVFRYLSNKALCILVLDNVDLYEDEDLEASVFAEGLALSKRIKCNVIVSIRDTTFIKHQSDATFNAYQLNKLWLDPPPFKSVLSKRLSYSKKILENRNGSIVVSNKSIKISDLGAFFDVVQRSILEGSTGHFIESMADQDIRKGLRLITSFLTSGHIEAERAMISYLKGDDSFTFPFHEVFRGTILGQWRHFQEVKANCLNIFDARLGVTNLLLLRLMILRELAFRAQQADTLEVAIYDLVKIFTKCGASENHITSCVHELVRGGLLRITASNDIPLETLVGITRSGGYLTKFLVNRFSYVEECMYDTAIRDKDTWQRLENLTYAVEHHEGSRLQRLHTRQERIIVFLDYLSQVESGLLSSLKHLPYLESLAQIKTEVLREVDRAIRSSEKYGL